MSESKFYAYCLTINNYTESDCLTELPKVLRYLIYGKETAATGTPHLQCYIYYKNQATFSAVKKRFPKAHIEVKSKNSTHKQAIDYCKKDGNYIELGEPPIEQGDNVNVWKQVADEIASGTYPTYKSLTLAYPEYAIKYVNGLKSYYELNRIKYQYSIKEQHGEYNEFQQNIINYISTTKPDRQILWIYDNSGGKGKSDMATELATKHGWLSLGNAKTADIAYAWNGENVVFDFSRTTNGRVNYDVIESIVGGRVFSPKYDSGVKIYAKPLVIVFANFPPETHTMTEDRWNIWTI